MKLVGARVQNYRSIEDSGWVDVEQDLTALVGKNESGKTAFMQALFKLNPIEAASYDEVLDFPSRLTARRKAETGPIPVCTVRLDISDAEAEAIESAVGVGVLVSRTIEVTHGYRFKARTYRVELDEAVAVEHLRTDLDLPAAAGKAVRAATSIAELVAALRALDEPTASATALLQTIENGVENGNVVRPQC